ncbi:MAG TPA: flagellar hook capping FlgD N-terminal domain-containing protein [Solirubrobacteraceae bacterium]|nr:flagellar hook capping FlgD N-terminal domain-containing protein [Solirubrobacteraceae bacterium]
MSTTQIQPSAASQGAQLSTPGTTLAPSGNGLGENAFLQLMMDQLQNQDPLNPTDPTQYLSELAQFSQLEQETTIASSASATAGQASTASALALLGRTVAYTYGGSSQTGTVSSVQFGSSGPTLTVGSASGIPLSAITEAS